MARDTLTPVALAVNVGTSGGSGVAINVTNGAVIPAGSMPRVILKVTNIYAGAKKVTVKAGSEDCWLFVKVEQPIAFATGVSYEIAEGWTMLEDGVYYREVSKADTDSEYYVLKENKVTVSSALTKEDIAKVGGSPTLTFTAYAVQQENITDAATAWSKIPQPTNP